jgi:GT2 family glycosyltransferase
MFSGPTDAVSLPRRRRLPDLGRAASALRRALKLYLHGERDRARRLAVDAAVLLRVPSPGPPTLRQVMAVLGPVDQPIRPLAEPADIVIPIHNGAAHLRRLLETLFERTDPRHRVLLADDASNDPRVAALLADVAARPNVAIARSDRNRGFVATVNAALAATRGHAVILNSDAEVPPAWIDRLLAPIEQSEAVASVAPFSNAAQIFSVPVPDRDHDLPAGTDTLEIDRAFARLRPLADAGLEAPTTIGFCMGISRRAWNALGPFDADTFGRGYCEETDWCLRARAAGWSNRLVPNLFVYHSHGGSFTHAERKALLETNLTTLYRRWPRYYRALASFRRRDPWAVYRAAALLALATAPESDPTRSVATVGRQVNGSTRMEIRVGSWAVGVIADTEQQSWRLQSVADAAQGRKIGAGS